MKIGILADIHGNLRALESILNAFKSHKVEKIYCLGDMIGYYHNSLEVLDLMMDLDVKCILGNHEAYLLGYLRCSTKKWQILFLEQVREKISSKHLTWLYMLPKTLEIKVNETKIAFFHGSPWDPLEEYIYPDSHKFHEFVGLPFNYIFLGHTHYSMQKNMGTVNIINPGSCGQPRDGSLKANATILDLESRKLTFINESYDIYKTIKEARLAGVSLGAIKILEVTNK